MPIIRPIEIHGKHFMVERDVAEEIERLAAALREVKETCEGGFVACRFCGEQEATDNMDFMPTVRAALRRKEASHG